MTKRPRKRHIYKKKDDSKKMFYKNKWFIIGCIALIVVGSVLAIVLTDKDKEAEIIDVKPYSFKVDKKYPHERTAFTQGLLYHDGFIFEGTGLYGQSEIRKVDLETGKVLISRKLRPNIFGEGLELHNDKFYQLTWKAGIVFIYDSDSLKLLDSLTIDGDGWGICSDGENLIQSDGTDILRYRNPDNFSIIKEIKVFDEKGPVVRLNELEYINGEVYANIWSSYKIAVINPENGNVNRWIDFSGIILPQEYPFIDVMNGIAYDEATERLFVTGKNWPYIYQVSIIPPN